MNIYELPPHLFYMNLFHLGDIQSTEANNLPIHRILLLDQLLIDI